MPGVEIIIPWRGGCPHRARALEWVSARHTRPVTPAEAPAGPWSKGAAIRPALEASAADIIVIADADVWTDGLEHAISAVSAGAAWAIPHDRVLRLTEDATTALLAGRPAEDLDEPAYRGLVGGGIVVAHRETLLTIPIDPRFCGWGQEDESWAAALDCLLGPPWRGTADLIHLWHPPQPRADRRRGSHEGWQLRRRYLTAHHDLAAMRALVQEAHLALSDQHPVHDPQPR